MITACTADCQHGVDIMDNHGTWIAMATQVGDYWFTIGTYKNLAMAKKKSIAALAKHGYEIKF